VDSLGAREDTLMRPEIKWAAAGGCLTLLALGSVLGIAGGVLTLAARTDRAAEIPDRFIELAKQESDAAYPASAPPPAPPEEVSPLAGAKGGTADRIDAPSRQALPKSNEEGREKEKDADGAESGPATRSWFPETFLFQPEVLTDANGNAQVAFMAPDRLTGWRILGLAHDRAGHQSGALARVQTALDLYVDLVVPRFLVVGDEVVLPVLIVNTSDSSRAARLSVQASGAGWRSVETELRVPARSSAVRDVPIRIERAGQLTVRATFGDDAIERTIEVLPEGFPTFTERSGTLGAPKSIEIDGDPRLDPRTADLRLVVHGGLQSVLEAELVSAPNRGQDAASVAYALQLLATGPRMIRDLGGEADGEAIRNARIVATQRAVRLARSPDVPTGSLLAGPCGDHADAPVLASLGERLASQLQAAQRPDGSFGGEQGGWPLQRLLVATGEAAAAASSLETEAGARRKALVMLRAQGTVERYLTRIEDPYTAAVLISSGATTGATTAKLRELVREAIVEEDGQRRLPVPSGVVRADGARPSDEEATALALLALQGDSEAPWLADLASTLLGSYRPGRGWGDGRTNLAVLAALAAAAPEPVRGPIEVTLTRDGQAIGRATLDLQSGQHVVVLHAADDAPRKPCTVVVSADPPAPGLTFTLTRRAWRPYEAADGGTGLELVATLSDDVRVGDVASLDLEGAAPAGLPLTIAIPLPAGVDPLPTALDSLQAGGVIAAWKSDAGALVLDVPPLSPGGRFQASVPVVATLKGELHAAPPTLAPLHDPDHGTHADPMVWRVHGP
jgi:hypothetical protein